MTSTSGPDLRERFFDAHFALEPVTATFTGFHDYDHRLPDWSPDGLERGADLMRAFRGELAPIVQAESLPLPAAAIAEIRLSDGHLEIKLAEQSGPHFQRGNPSLWSGEAVFSVIALATRDFAPVEQRMQDAAARARAIPQFLADAATTLGSAPLPSGWTERALRECVSARVFFDIGIDQWIADAGPVTPSVISELRAAAAGARAAFDSFATRLRETPASAPQRYACGDELLGLLLRRGHGCTEPVHDLITEALAHLGGAKAKLDEMARAVARGGWREVQDRLTADHPAPSGYYAAFASEWDACRALAESAKLVTWADTPVRFVPIPSCTRAASAGLYFLNYRSPAPLDRIEIHDHFVPHLDPRLPPRDQETCLRATNRSVIRLNHVIHHAALGHHVQNHHANLTAPGSTACLGRVAAVDAASRLAMFCGGTMAEGWACYAVDLAEEFGMLTSAERVSQQHTRVRILCRAIVDLSLHTRQLSFDECCAFYCNHAMMAPAAARAETVKNSMFPGAAVMYWLGTRGIHGLRAEQSARAGAAFSLRAFHDTLLSFGSIPVPVVASLMNAATGPT